MNIQILRLNMCECSDIR